MSTIRSIFSSRLIPGLRQFLFWPEINHAFFAAFHWLFVKPGTEDSSFPLEAHYTLKPAEPLVMSLAKRSYKADVHNLKEMLEFGGETWK